MDFVTGSGCDVIWVIVDRLTKTARFLPVKMTWTTEKLAELYIPSIAPASIVSDRDPRFTSRLWEKLQVAMGTKLKFNTSYHPQTDGQSERTLEDMLRACVLDLQSWEAQLGMIE